MKEKFFRPEIMDKSLTLNPKNTFEHLLHSTAFY